MEWQEALSNTKVGDGQAGHTNREPGHLEVREYAVAQEQGEGRNLGPVHSCVVSFHPLIIEHLLCALVLILFNCSIVKHVFPFYRSEK